MLQLDPELNIVGASAQRERLLAWLAQTHPDTSADAPEALHLDLSRVDSFDSAGVQLLLATRHSLAARGQVLRLTGVSQQVGASLATLGLGPLLPVDAHPPAAADTDDDPDSPDAAEAGDPA